MLERFRRRWQVLRSHPVARRQPISVLARFANTEIINTVLGYPFLVSHEFGVTLIVERGHHATRGHYFFGIQDFEDELFAIHFLRDGELFIDIGANLGMFSIMVTAATGAHAIAVEPSPSSARTFRRHITLNDLADRITLIEACAGVGGDSAFIKDTVNMNNFVAVDDADVQPDMTKVPMIKIDDVVDGSVPCVMKMDVEGFEMQALKGAPRLLGHQNLRAIIVEISDFSRRFGSSPEETHRYIAAFGFTATAYDPLTRILQPLAMDAPQATLDNYIYVRDLEEARNRLSSAPHRSLRTLAI